MPAAFNWSPGGCCCVSDDILDLYWGFSGGAANQCAQWPGGSNFRRVTSNKTATTEWHIEPTLPISNIIKTITASGDEEVAWAIYRDSSGGRHSARFNVDTKTEEIPATSIGNPSSGVGFMDAVSRTNYGMIWFGNIQQGQSHILEIHGDGGKKSSFFRFIDDNIRQLAKRYWPLGCGVGFDGQLMFYLFNGVSVIGAPPNGHLFVQSKQTIYQVPDATSVSNSGFIFDQTPDGWAGVVSYVAGISVQFRHNVFLINGVEKEHLTFAPGNELFEPVILSVHVSHPHETIGPVVVVTRRVPGHVPARQKFETYNLNGDKTWESVPILANISCWASSDRWLYVGANSNYTEMPGVVLEPAFSRSLNWLLRHDGSESVPLNSLVQEAFGSKDCVRNSSRFDRVPPLENFLGRACD